MDKLESQSLKESAWRSRLLRYARAAAIFVINTIAGNDRVLSSRLGYGHYIAVRLAVDVDQHIRATYADSLGRNVDASRTRLGLPPLHFRLGACARELAKNGECFFQGK